MNFVRQFSQSGSFRLPAIAVPIVPTPPVCTGSCQIADHTLQQELVLAEAMPLPLIISRTVDGNILFANAQAETTFGLPRENLIGRKTQELYYSATERRDVLHKLLQQGYLHNHEIRVKTSGDRPLWVSVSINSITYRGEAAFLTTFYDISERKEFEQTLKIRAEQQAAVAELGQQALAGIELPLLIEQAARLVAHVLTVEYSAVLERCSNRSTLLLRSGVGWQPDLTETTFLTECQTNSPLSGALFAQQPVVIENLCNDPRFQDLPLLHQHQVVSGVSVVISGREQPFGILGGYTRQQRTFSQDDIYFLQAIAHILATTISRQQSEAQLHLMKRAIAASNNGIVLTDANQPNNPIIYVNPAFETITGYSAEEVIGRNCRFLQGADQNQECLKQLRKAIQEQRECHITLRNYRKDGTPFWNELYIAPVLNAEGNLTHFVGIQTDVTERKRAEEALHHQEQQYRRIVETAIEGIWLLDQDSNTSFVNSQMAMMLGYSVDEMLGKGLFEFMDEEGVAIATMYLNRRQQGIQEAHDFKFRRKDGTVLWAIVSTTPLMDNQGNYAGALGMLTDITARKQAEAALRESEQRLDSILASLEDVVWSFSVATAKTVYLNPAAEKVYGRPLSAFLANPNLRFEVIHPDDQASVRAAVQDVRQVGSSEIEYRIIRPDGEVRWLYDRCRATYDESGQPIRFDGIASDITERKRMEQQLIHDACHDALTGLPNRVLFMDRLQQAIAQANCTSGQSSSSLFAILFLDLDRFKVINDSLGHVVGDQMLVAIAQRLQTCLRTGDVVARLGGDEFVILLNTIQHTNDAIRVAERIQQSLKSPYTLNGYEVFTTASIGIVLSTTGFSQPEDLLRDADTALHHAKEQGKARYAVFDTAMYDRAVALLQLETNLRWALERQELQVYYQPIVSLTTGKISGFEALVRWHHPEQGVISPAQFIPIAEETGLIVPIGQWVLQQACQQLRQWQDQFSVAASLTMNVNLSSKQFSQPDLVEQIAQVLQETDLTPKNLKLEITESGIMENDEPIVLLRRLKALGVQLCIDDFGTGYSSLSRLRQFPIDTLKIDHSFINSINDKGDNAEIAQAIITLSHNLGMDVVAEGLETAEQVSHLRWFKCEQGQGYFFSKPVNNQLASALLAIDPQW